MSNYLSAVFMSYTTCHHFYRFVLFSILFLLLSIRLQAQYFVSDGYCPISEGVTFDTLTYSPNKAMPFDRCFVLQITLPTAQHITKFFVTPIDKNGKHSARRRDRRVFIKSGWTSYQDRRKARHDNQFKDFANDIIKRAFTNVSPHVKSRQITLLVPPLDPGREYRIYLASDDEEAAENYLVVGDLLVQGKGDFSGTIPANSGDLIEDAEIEFTQSNSRNTHRSISIGRPTFNEYITNLTSFSLVFNPERITPTINYSYRLLFAPLGYNIATPAAAATITDYIQVADKSYPDTASIQLPFTDSQGKRIDPFTDWIGSVYLLTMAQPLKPAPLPARPLKLTDLGQLDIKKNGLIHTFTSNTAILGSSYIKLLESPLDLYRKISVQKVTLGSTPNLSITADDTIALRFLLTQASQCPCVEKGIKDLTQKDDLVRTISLLFERNDNVITPTLQGLINLKNPFASPGDPNSLVSLSTNYGESINQINDLIEFARKEAALQLVQVDKLRDLLQHLDVLRTGLIAQLTATKQIISAQTALHASFTRIFDLSEIKPVGVGSTTELNLLTETKFRIIPDFGFVALFKGNNLYDFQDFTPYLGFQVGFRSMDKNLELRMIHYKSWRHRLSFMSGITLKSLKIDGQREDFFGNNSLITGFGFRLNNYFRVTSGVVWFKATDPNRLTNNKPLRFSPFIGLSLDLDLQDLFGGIKKLF